jgi:hypothetical protein
VKMYQYSLEERLFIVKTYWITGSIRNFQRRFVKRFDGQNPPQIIGPMFFDTTVTSQVYTELFQEFVNQLDNQELALGYYQQDGATSHTSGVSMAEVESMQRATCNVVFSCVLTLREDISYRYDMQL